MTNNELIWLSIESVHDFEMAYRILQSHQDKIDCENYNVTFVPSTKRFLAQLTIPINYLTKIVVAIPAKDYDQAECGMLEFLTAYE